MYLIKFFLSVLCCIFFAGTGFAQTDSCDLKITLLTCGPGKDLYSIFGHSAIRVRDRNSQRDIIYNYGTFEFSDPDFYIKFVKGKLRYSVSTEQYSQFMEEYELENRSVTEQVLRLSCSEQQQLSAALQWNARDENKYYLYEFLFDNCSTRIRDIIKKNTRDSIHFKSILPQPVQTFREMLHVCLDTGKLYWSKLGIDLALGSLIDRKLTNEEAMFLPDYLLKGYDSAFIDNIPVTLVKRPILRVSPEAEEEEPLFTPLNSTVFLLVLIVALTMLNKKGVNRFLAVFDVTLFLITGAIGCFLLLMWFGTEHDLCANNYNLLWALPLHFFVSFFIFKNRSWVKNYFLCSAVFYLLLVLFWSFIPQGMNPAFIPLALVLGLRSFDLATKK